MVDAFLSFVRAGERPTSAEVASKAGVTQRTLFNRFPDVRSLLAAAVERQLDHVSRILPAAPTSGSVVSRIDAYVSGLSRVLDEIANVRWAIVTHPDVGAEVVRGMNAVRQMTRGRLRALFGAQAAEELIDAAEIATDPLTWRLLRTQCGLSRTRAADVLRRTLCGLALTGA
jgi:AcrR family transcriptional regulator